MAFGPILTAMVTPFDADGAVDEEATVRLLHHLADNGSDGAVVAATTGEASVLSDEEHVGLVRLAVEQAPAGFTVLAGAGSNDTRHACALTERCTEAGAQGILSVTPYYVRPSRKGILAHFGEVARATDRPVLLYNIPSRTATDMPNDLLAELAQIDGIEGVKQARYENLARIDGLDLYAGNDDLLAQVLDLGGAGGILVAAHLVGREMRRMVDAPDRRHEIEDGLRDLYAALFVTSNPTPLKAALNLIGLDVGGHRLPLVDADEDELAVIRGALERHGLLERARA